MPLTDALARAEAPCSDPEAARAALDRALAERPDDPEVRLAAYRMCFYTHRLADALDHAEALARLTARSMNLPADWRLTRAEDAAFDAALPQPGLYLQCLTAIGYCAARLEREELAREALSQALALDPKGRFGAGLVLSALEAREDD